MLCPKCKKELEKGSWFCPYCGEMIDTSTSESTKEETLATTAMTATSTVPTQELPQVGVLPEGPVVAPLASTLSPEEHKKQTENRVALGIIMPVMGIIFYVVLLFFPVFESVRESHEYNGIELLFSAGKAFNYSLSNLNTHTVSYCFDMVLMAGCVVGFIDGIVLVVKRIMKFSKFGENYQKELNGTGEKDKKLLEFTVADRLVGDGFEVVMSSGIIFFCIIHFMFVSTSRMGNTFVVILGLLAMMFFLPEILNHKYVNKLFKRRVSQ